MSATRREPIPESLKTAQAIPDTATISDTADTAITAGDRPGIPCITPSVTSTDIAAAPDIPIRCSIDEGRSSSLPDADM